jgi:signal transduction histidine kinase
MNGIEMIVPFTIILFIIAFGVILLYTNFQKNLIALELEQAQLKSLQQDELLRNSILVQEQERKRIAGDLHDEIGAVVSILKMNLILMRQKHEQTSKDIQQVKDIQNLINLANTAISSVRNISHQLTPPQLEAFGLVKTIESVISNINQSGNLRVDFSVKCEWPIIEWPIALGIYRIIMELINNTIKHANANYILLAFACTNQNLVVTFEDDGNGFSDTSPLNAGLGLISMESRAKALNGQFAYQNGKENGISAILHIPLGQPLNL